MLSVDIDECASKSLDYLEGGEIAVDVNPVAAAAGEHTANDQLGLVRTYQPGIAKLVQE